MPLLRVEAPGKPNILRIQLDRNTLIRLRRYSRFTSNGTMDSIVTSALNYCFDADNDFKAWENDPANQKDDDLPKRQTKKTATTSPLETTENGKK